MKTFACHLVAICAFLSPLIQSTQAQFAYQNNGDGTCTVTGYYGAGGAVAIPTTNVNGLLVTGIGYGAFGNLDNVTSVTIPSSVTFIGNDAFSGCGSLNSISIPNSVTSIGEMAFNACTSLTSVTIPNSVTSIGGEAFEECTELTTVTLGTSLGEYEFVDCYSLTSVYFTGNAPIADGTMFQSDGHATAYYLPDTVGWAAFSADTGLPVVMESVPATITAQPQPVLVNAYSAASFSVSTYGTMPMNYQWLLNGSNISGATASSLTIPSVTQTNLGMYAVVVANAFGTNTSTNAALLMYPFIATPFTGAVTYWGQSSTLSLSAWGTGPLSYQWFKNGVAIQNATNRGLTISTIQATNAGLYSVVVTSEFGSATNAPAQVIVEPAGVSLGFSPTLTINGVAGYNYVIQGSTNLAETNGWVTLTNLTLTQPVQTWVDTTVNASSPFFPTHFYQVLPGQ